MVMWNLHALEGTHSCHLQAAVPRQEAESHDGTPFGRGHIKVPFMPLVPTMAPNMTGLRTGASETTSLSLEWNHQGPFPEIHIQ